MRPAALQHPLRDSRICGDEVSWRSLNKGAWTFRIRTRMIAANRLLVRRLARQRHRRCHLTHSTSAHPAGHSSRMYTASRRTRKATRCKAALSASELADCPSSSLLMPIIQRELRALVGRVDKCLITQTSKCRQRSDSALGRCAATGYLLRSSVARTLVERRATPISRHTNRLRPDPRSDREDETYL
jgi:hypothetical protein